MFHTVLIFCGKSILAFYPVGGLPVFLYLTESFTKCISCWKVGAVEVNTTQGL